MSVSYSLVKYVPKFGKNAGKGKFYARAQVNEKTSLKKFSKMIAMQTTVTYADVTAVLVSAVENLILELQRGNQVEFGDLGKFRLQMSVMVLTVPLISRATFISRVSTSSMLQVRNSILYSRIWSLYR